MYTPASFAVSDRDRLHEFINQHSFASLITVNAGELAASHLPLLFDRDPGDFGRLLGHMARANPQWRDAEGIEALAIFHGPHAYISPTWYEAPNTVPTWNYVAVHVYGTLRIVRDRAELRQIIEQTVEQYERGRQSPWNLNVRNTAFLDGLLDAIVGFTLDITRIEGKWKLSQNHDAARREKVIHALRNDSGENPQAIADLMQRTLDDPG